MARFTAVAVGRHLYSTLSMSEPRARRAQDLTVVHAHAQASAYSVAIILKLFPIPVIPEIIVA